MQDQDNPGVIAPPPLIYGGVLLLALAAERFLISLPIAASPSLRWSGAAACIAAAVLLVAGAFTRFRAAGTHVEPWRPTTAVVTTGVYRFTRNPMYLAMTLAYIGVALLADSGIAMILLMPLLVCLHYGVIAREERYLARKFGAQYESYKASVRRWV